MMTSYKKEKKNELKKDAACVSAYVYVCTRAYSCS